MSGCMVRKITFIIHNHNDDNHNVFVALNVIGNKNNVKESTDFEKVLRYF